MTPAERVCGVLVTRGLVPALRHLAREEDLSGAASNVIATTVVALRLLPEGDRWVALARHDGSAELEVLLGMAEEADSQVVAELVKRRADEVTLAPLLRAALLVLFDLRAAELVRAELDVPVADQD